VTPKAFLKEICASPDDDAPRLVYADWLDDHGEQERAEFIRAQIELAQPPAPRSRTRRLGLERRVKALWKRHGEAWAAGPGGGGAKYLEWWERGFAATFYIKGIDALMAELPKAMRRAPIQHVRASGVVGADLPKLLAWPLLTRLRSLQLFAAGLHGAEASRLIGDEDVRLIAQCPHLTRLEGLDLIQHRIGPAGLHTLTHADNLPALRDLEMYGNVWNDEGLRVVVRSPLAPRLRKLHAGGGPDMRNITAAGARALARTPALARLRVLNLDNTVIGDAGARALAGSKHLAGLTELWLHECDIGTAGAIALAESPHLANLEVLDLSSNWKVYTAAAVALAESPYLMKIRRLDLWRCEGITGNYVRMLRKRFRSRVNFDRSY
jgi:uncharacterized protein (TIGR02996 family)